MAGTKKLGNDIVHYDDIAYLVELYDGGASAWVQLTQAEYDALSPPVDGTLYIIVG